jgi:hypothetical protein
MIRFKRTWSMMILVLAILSSVAISTPNWVSQTDSAEIALGFDEVNCGLITACVAVTPDAISCGRYGKGKKGRKKEANLGDGSNWIMAEGKGKKLLRASLVVDVFCKKV